MFTLVQIKEAHARVKSGADFPQYTQDLIALGVSKYTLLVHDGHAEYIGKEGYTISSNAEYSNLDIADKIDIDNFKKQLKSHQRGETDYSRFCKDSAENGVAKWTVDIHAKTCTYYGKSDEFILEEKIPI